MIKKLKTWGSGLGIYFDKEEVDNYGMVEGDVLDLSDMLVKKISKSNKENTKKR